MFALQRGPVQMEHHFSEDMGYMPHDDTLWNGHHSCPPSTQQTPMHEYHGFSFSPPNISRESAYGDALQYTRTAQPVQPATIATWPSQLATQSAYIQPLLPTAPPPPPRRAPAPPLPMISSQPSQQQSTPRRTLTDSDRRKMCQYHEDHPTKKQTEIGEMFGVERSTVSKVLRQKEKYLIVSEDSRSPIKRSRGKFPDIEKALANWARNYQKQGKMLTDDLIREKLQFFATTCPGSEGLKINNDGWLQRFKQKNQLVGTNSRKSSLPTDTKHPLTRIESSPADLRTQTSPMPAAMSFTKSQDSIKVESLDGQAHRPFHSQSNASLSSMFSEGALSSFSGDTGQSSPLFTPDSAAPVISSPFVSTPQTLLPSITNNHNPFRPRSMTMPVLGSDNYISPPPSSEAATPKFGPSGIVESPTSEALPQLNIQDPRRPSTATTASITISPSMPPPTSLSTGIQPSSTTTQGNAQQYTPISPAMPSPDEAREALKTVMNFLQNQPAELTDSQDLHTVGKLMDKLRLQSSRPVCEMPGGFQRMISTAQHHQHLEYERRRSGGNIGPGDSGY